MIWENKKSFWKRNELVANRFIRGWLAKNKVGIVHGARAQNEQLPKFLERKSTRDWDIFVKKPKLRANQLERYLDKKYRGDFFRVKPGATKKLKVQKVVSNIDDLSVADFSIPDRVVPTVAIRGVRLAALSDQKKRALQNLKKKETQFRREKDLNLIKRIRKFEKLRGKKI